MIPNPYLPVAVRQYLNENPATLPAGIAAHFRVSPRTASAYYRRWRYERKTTLVARLRDLLRRKPDVSVADVLAITNATEHEVQAALNVLIAWNNRPALAAYDDLYARMAAKRPEWHQEAA